MCISSLKESKCPKCKSKIEQKAINWSVINHINKYKYTPDKLKKMETKMFHLEQELEDKKASSNEYNTKRIKELMSKLNEREVFLHEKIKEYKQELLDILNERMNKSNNDINPNQDKKQLPAHSFFDENDKIKENYTISEVKSQIENKSKEISIKLKLLESKMSDNRLDIKPVNDDLLAQYMFGVFIENLPSFILVIYFIFNFNKMSSFKINFF